MRHEAQSGFLIASSSVMNDILIPRYYDPRIASDISQLEPICDLSSIKSLVSEKALEHSHGSYVPKIYYGTGPYPYIRTSDMANCEIKASPKHGVAQEVFDKYHRDQDVKRLDILFVHEGTYLIGASSMVTAYDGEILYQHHLAKFRVTSSSKFDSYYFLACINSDIVQRQIRSKQFTADIIDSVVGRVDEIVVPIHRDHERVKYISSIVKDAVEGRAKARESLSYTFSFVDSHLSGQTNKNIDHILKWEPTELGANNEYTRFLGKREGFKSFSKLNSAVVDDILIPKYYDPTIQARLDHFSANCDLITIGQLIDKKILSLSSGDEIGKTAYGTGQTSFVRTSDLGTYELLRDTKHNISDDVYQLYSAKQDVLPGDIFIVRDGTYLVGSSVIVSEYDLPLLYCAGINKIRVHKNGIVDPYMLYTLLNLPVVKDQMRSKQFTRDVIDTIGHRLKEVFLPLPRDAAKRDMISDITRTHYENRIKKRIALTNIFGSIYAS